MEYVNLGKQGARVSRLCLGTMMFGGPTGESDSIKIIHRALDDGVNFIDTANRYNAGQSERIVGKALGDRRDRAFLTTKGGNTTGDGPNDRGGGRAHLFKAIEDSLKRLNQDYVDLYLLHQPDYGTPLEETMGVMNDLVRQGKTRYVGLSNHYAWRVCEAMWMADRRSYEPVSCVQPLYNMVNRDVEIELFPFCQQFGVGVMVYSPLARGILTGKYLPGQQLPEGSRAARGDARIQQAELREESKEVAQAIKPLADSHAKTMSQFALNWVLANPIVTSAIIGPRTMEQYEESLGSLGWKIEQSALDEIDRLVPPGEHTGYGFNDPHFPVRGRPLK